MKYIHIDIQMHIYQVGQVGIKSMKMSYLTSIPPIQKSTIRIQINQDDMKKNSSTRNVEAVMTKTTAPLASMLTISSSESPAPFLAVEDS